MVKPGMFIGDRYEIINKIGSGGMADVYKAKCHRLNRFVAIKILKQEFSEDKKFVDKFRGEAQSVAGLSHPNIVNVYDVGEDDGLYYIVMELVEGITLKNFIERKGTLEIKEATGIAIQVAQGIEAAHNSHMIHRDIKPQNIIISKEGKVKVTDFGIAKAASSNTITSNAMGSVHYISPEQARGGYSDEKSDIYSLGVTLYEMLTGQVPFEGDNTVSVALSHIQEDAVSIRTLNPLVTPSLDKIVQKCMQKKPERRYLTATALIGDLKKSISDPNGDFIQLTPTLIDDSPTINLSKEEVNAIRHAAKHTPVMTKEPQKEEEDSFEEEKELDPKLEKITIIGGSITAIILVIIIIVVISKAFNIGKNREDEIPSPSPSPISEEETIENPEVEEIRVPQLRGDTREIAEGKITEMGLVPIIREEPSDLREEGIVFDQNPAWDDIIEPGGSVEIFVSTGPEITMVSVPTTNNYTVEEAKVLITEAGLMIGTAAEAYSDTVEAGKVISTEPAAGSLVERDSYVRIIYSKGKENKMAIVPNLVEMTQKEAEIKLAEVNLKLKNQVNFKPDNNVKKDLIISQSHNSGTQVVEGTEISIVISTGPEVTPTYEASFTVTANPFDYPEEEGFLLVVLNQDGKKTTVYEGYVDYYSFPLLIPPITSKSDSVGEITLSLDGENYGSVYSVVFKEVE